MHQNPNFFFLHCIKCPKISLYKLKLRYFNVLKHFFVDKFTLLMCWPVCNVQSNLPDVQKCIVAALRSNQPQFQWKFGWLHVPYRRSLLKMPDFLHSPFSLHQRYGRADVVLDQAVCCIDAHSFQRIWIIWDPMPRKWVF